MSKSELFHDGISSFGTPRAIVNGLIFRCSHATSITCGVVEERMELLKASEARPLCFLDDGFVLLVDLELVLRPTWPQQCLHSP